MEALESRVFLSAGTWGNAGVTAEPPVSWLSHATIDTIALPSTTTAPTGSDNVVAPPVLPAYLTRVGNVLTVRPGGNLREAFARTRVGDTVQLVAGLYPVDPRVSLAPPAGVTVQGVGADTVIRVMDGVGDYTSVFGGQTAFLHDFTLRDLTLDLNPGGYGGNPTGARPAAGVLAWRFDGVTVDSIRCFYGGAVAIDLNGPAGVARNASVTNSYFQFNQAGATPFDNCAVYLECYNGNASYNTIVSQTDFWSSGIELHGGPAQAIGNTISGVQVGINLAAAVDYDSTSPSGNMLVQSNTILDVAYGVLLWSAKGQTLQDVTVDANDITLGKRWTVYWTTGVAVNYGSDIVGGAYTGLTVTNNTTRFEDGDLRSLDRVHSGGVSFETNGTVTDVTAYGNTVVNLPPSLL